MNNLSPCYDRHISSLDLYALPGRIKIHMLQHKYNLKCILFDGQNDHGTSELKLVVPIHPIFFIDSSGTQPFEIEEEMSVYHRYSQL